MSYHEPFFSTESKVDEVNVFMTLGNEPLYRSVQTIGGLDQSDVPRSINESDVSQTITDSDVSQSFHAPAEPEFWKESLTSITNKKNGLEDIVPLSVKEEQDVLCPVPVYYERTSFRISHQTPADILDSVIRQLKSKECDFSVDFPKYLIRIVTAPSNLAQSCTLHVRLFRNTDGTVLVEFQRRKGCMMSYCRFYQDVSTLVKQEIGNEAVAAEECVSCPSSGSCCEIDLNTELLNRLVEMGDTDSLLCISAACVASAANLSCLISYAIQSPSKLFLFLQSTLKDADTLDQLAAARLLSHMANEERLRKPLLESFLSLAYASLECSQSALLARDVKRELARMLNACSVSHASTMLSASTLLNINALRKIQTQSNDGVLSTLIAGTLSRLGLGVH